MQKYNSESLDSLFDAILKLKNREECRSFFEDVCTIKELQDISQRLEVASMLVAGRSYQEISKLTGASTSTISRVNRCINYGAGGYSLVIGEGEGRND